jgi:hypothetical protein
MPCEKCVAIDGKRIKDISPHNDLELVSSDDWSKKSAGWAKGTINHDVCKACGTKLIGDFDKKDEFAIYEIAHP